MPPVFQQMAMSLHFKRPTCLKPNIYTQRKSEIWWSPQANIWQHLLNPYNKITFCTVSCMRPRKQHTQITEHRSSVAGGAWGHVVDESTHWGRAVLCGLRGTEALCWQIGDQTHCIVYALPTEGKRFFIHPFLHSSPAPFNLAVSTPLPILHTCPHPSPPSLTTLGNSTFPDVRWLLHQWDGQAFSCSHLAFESSACVGHRHLPFSTNCRILDCRSIRLRINQWSATTRLFLIFMFVVRSTSDWWGTRYQSFTLASGHFPNFFNARCLPFHSKQCHFLP